jgi:hypothetical protein
VGWGWALPAVFFSAATIALAIWAALPRESSISPGDLEQVNAYFTEQIKFRGRFLKASALTLCLALLCLPLPFIASAWESPDPALELTAARHGKGLVVHVGAQHIDSDATLTVRLRAHHGFHRTVGRSSGAIDGAVALVISLPIRSVPPCAQLVVRVFEHGNVALARSVKLGRGLSAPGPMPKSPSVPLPRGSPE